MKGHALLLIALGLLGFGLVSKRAQRSVVTAPMVFVLLGLVAGPAVLGLLQVEFDAPLIHFLTELTLVLVLFTDATRIDLKLLWREHSLPLRLLLVGLPLTIAAGTIAGMALLPGLGVSTVIVLAVILAPTDAALGQAVVGSPRVPVRIRQTLNVESGLNDGLVLPVLLIALSVCSAAHTQDAAYWARFVVLQVTLGPLVGVVVGWAGGKLVERASGAGWMGHSFQELSALALAVAAFAGAEAVGGNGFIAAFVAGLTLGNSSRAICACLVDFGEAEGQLLMLLVFLIFGASLAPEALAAMDAAGWLYALLSLTVLRMLPVAISLIGTRLRPVSVLFLGWFGPRGLASILFALLVIEEWMVPGVERISNVVMTTVFLSVLLHGLTAWPASVRFGARMEGLKAEPDIPEHAPVTEMPLRVRGMP